MTIVNQYPVMAERFPVWVIFLNILGISICSYILFLCVSNQCWSAVIISGCFIASFCIILFLGAQKRETGRNRYECLIDDTVPFVEVVENYDVVSQRGELWILEDRDEISVD